MDAYHHPILQPTLVYHTIPVLVMPASSASRFAAHHRGTTPRHHPYVRKTVVARPNDTPNMPAPIPPPYGFAQPQPLPNAPRRPPLYVPPHPLDTRVAIHPPLSPREIHKRQQARQGRRLVALFSIPEFTQAVRNGFDAAMLERKAGEASAVPKDSKNIVNGFH